MISFRNADLFKKIKEIKDESEKNDLYYRFFVFETANPNYIGISPLGIHHPFKDYYKVNDYLKIIYPKFRDAIKQKIPYDESSILSQGFPNFLIRTDKDESLMDFLIEKVGPAIREIKEVKDIYTEYKNESIYVILKVVPK